jgi:replicative DNA helicase
MNQVQPADFTYSTLPASVEAERSILGAILLDNASFNEAAGQLSVAEFSLDSHRRIFRHMTSLAGAGKPIDMITLIEQLDRTHDLAPVGDVGYISDLIDGVPDRPSIEHYVRIVKEKAQLRAVLSATATTAAIIADGATLQEVTAGLLEVLLNMEEQSGRNRATTPKEFMPEVLGQLQLQAGSDGLVGLPTGLDCLDNVTGGLRPGELVVVGARPGAGKSALAAQMAIANAVTGNPVGFFSLEMSRWDLGRRFLSAATNVPAYKIRDPRYLKTGDPAWLSLAIGGAEAGQWPMLVDDSGSLNITELIARAKLFIARNKAKLIIVDYLQLVRAVGITDIRERVGHVADQLRILAKTEQIPVVLLSQLRRPQNPGDEPTLIDLKESGDIEAHAHIVLLIHSPVGSDMKPTGQQKLIVAKNRNGIRGAEAVTLNEYKLLFYSRFVQ